MDEEFVVDSDLAAEHILKYGSLSKLQGKLRLAEVQPATDVNIAIYKLLKQAYDEVMANHSFGEHTMTKSEEAVTVAEYLTTVAGSEEDSETKDETVVDPNDPGDTTFEQVEKGLKVRGIDYVDSDGLISITSLLAVFRSWRVIKLILYATKYSTLGVAGIYVKTPLSQTYSKYNIKTERIKDNIGRYGFYFMVPRSNNFLREVFDDVIWLRYDQNTSEIILEYKSYVAHANFQAVYQALWNSIKRGPDSKRRFCSAGQTERVSLGGHWVDIVVPQVIGNDYTVGSKDSYVDFVGDLVETVNLDQSTYSDTPPLEKTDEIAILSYMRGRVLGAEDIYFQKGSLIMLPDGLISPAGVSFDQSTALSIVEKYPKWMRLKGEDFIGQLVPDQITQLYSATLKNRLKFMGPSVMVTNVSECSQTISYPWDVPDDFE